MVKVGIIGCGGISRFHIDGYDRAGARITHVCDIRQESAQRIGERFGAQVSTDYRTVIDDPNVDMISILTPASTHKHICLAAIAAGKGVVCEKTLAENPENSAIIAQTAQDAGIFCGTAYMKRFFPATQKAKELLADMGEVISVHALAWQPWDLWTGDLDPELLRHPSVLVRNYGGGVLVMGGSHILDLTHWLLGRSSQVFGTLHTREGMDADIRANAMLWLEQGGLINIEACWHPYNFIGYERNGWDERLEINTVKGRLDISTVLWNQPERNATLLVHYDNETGQSIEFRYPQVNPFDIEMAEMVRRFEAGEQAMPSAWDGYVVDELIATITESSRQKAVLPVRYRDRIAAGGGK